MYRMKVLLGFGAATGVSLGLICHQQNRDLKTRAYASCSGLTKGISNPRQIDVIYDVAIIGGGILGCSVGYHLASLDKKKKKKIAILEKGTIGCEASSLAAGTLCHDGNDIKEPSWYDYLSTKSRPILHDLESKYGIELDLIVNGTLTVAETAAEKAYLLTAYKEMKANGSNVRFLSSHDEVAKLEPAVKGGSVIGAIYSPLGGHADPSKVTHGLCEAAEIEGAHVFEGQRVISVNKIGMVQDEDSACRYEVRTSQGKSFWARHVVVCTGCHDNKLLRESFGIEIPVIPVKGQIWVTDVRPSGTLNTVIYNAASEMTWRKIREKESEKITEKKLLPRQANINSKWKNGERMFHHVYGRQTADGTLLFGGDRIVVNGNNGHLDYAVEEERVKENYDFIKKIVPTVGDMYGSYCCYMPFSMCEDGKPLLGELTNAGLNGLWLAVGFGPSGITLGPMAGKLLAETILSTDCEYASADSDSPVMRELDPNRVVRNIISRSKSPDSKLGSQMPA
mmetsp:Transcript_12746/g.16575  ORF Transcript_12746/g.16575 Transcript_12746/m.16575 type:complete len:509 (+) Transcript_12746:535-2061(+)